MMKTALSLASPNPEWVELYTRAFKLSKRTSVYQTEGLVCFTCTDNSTLALLETGPCFACDNEDASAALELESWLQAHGVGQPRTLQ
jgi:hypothetical protein